MKNQFNLQDAFDVKMKESGLTVKNVRQLHLKLLTQVETEALGHSKLGSFKIPYFDFKGKPTNFYRLRYLEDGRSGFDIAAHKKSQRYTQPHGTLNEVYLPPIMDWDAIRKDVNVAILITEGELKAACGCANGFPVIGLGGVWNFRAAKKGVLFLQQLEDIEWRNRVVVIVYDSDAKHNPQVMHAEHALAKELLKRGAQVLIGRLPDPTNTTFKKQGLDDLIVAQGSEALQQVIDNALIFNAAEPLFQLNTEVVYVRDPGLVLKLDKLQRMTPRAFTDHAFSTRIYYDKQETTKKDGSVTVKVTEKSAAKEWLKWGNRFEVDKVTYAPGQPLIYDNVVNVWPGWGLEPKEGDVGLWKDLIDFIFGGNDECITWFERWCAYPLQYPGTKMFSCVVVWGVKQGTGKSLIGYTLGLIYGKNFTEIKNYNLTESHNEWAENKQFVMGDEITSGDKRGVADRLKSMVTQKEVRLNPKYIPSYTVPDCINYYHTSNHPDAFFLEDSDRRYFIWEVKGPPAPAIFYKNYAAWLGQGGAANLFYYLLNLDLGDFEPAGHAPMTDSKMDMIYTGKSDLGCWVTALKDSPQTVLKTDNVLINCDLFRAEDLLKLYDPAVNTRVTANGMSRELRRAGFERLNNGKPCRTGAGFVRLYAIRNENKYVGLSGTEIGNAYDKERNQNVGNRNTQRKF